MVCGSSCLLLSLIGVTWRFVFIFLLKSYLPSENRPFTAVVIVNREKNEV